MRIQVENIAKSIQGKPILHDISFEIEDGQSLALIGPNGCGKSTLLRIMAGLLRADRGHVSIGEDRIGALSPRKLAQRLGFVSQDAGTTDAISVIDAVKLGRTPWLSFAAPHGQADDQIVEAALQEMAISPFQDKRFNALSGGERQRVHIARVLAQTPQVFLLDEPTNHLDIRHQIAIMDWIGEQTSTVAVALHDLNHAQACDRVALMNAGQLVAFGAPQEVLVPDIIGPVFQVEMQQTFAEAFENPILTFAQSKAAG